MEIYTQQDYLHAHLTLIRKESRDWYPLLRTLKQRIASVLKTLRIQMI